MNGDAAALALFEKLAATPRAAGSAEESEARRACAEFLEGHGFETREMRFSYSSIPGRWGVPIVGAIWFVGGLAAVCAGADPVRERAAAIAFAMVVTGWVTSLGLGLTVSSGRLGRQVSANLVAFRGVDPVIWLCAHLDTKSQGVSTLVRTGTLMAAGASATVLALLHVTRVLGGAAPGPVWIVLATVLAVAGVVMMACVAGNASPGAADNASGVMAVLSAAAGTEDKPLGVVLTSAEELGLAGAKAWAASDMEAGHPRPRLVINCDTLDDEGDVRCVVHKRTHRAIAADLVAAGAAVEVPIRVTRYTPGIMVDSAAVAARGIPAVTLSRVTLGTLQRIHTPRDSADRLSGSGIDRAAAAMTSFVRDHA